MKPLEEKDKKGYWENLLAFVEQRQKYLKAERRKELQRQKKKKQGRNK